MSLHARAVKKCFISAPFGVSTDALENALRIHGVEGQRFDTLEPGSDVLKVLETQVHQADVVFGIFPKGSDQQSVMFEVGLARGLGRPIVLFVDPELDLPRELSTIRSITTRISDNNALNSLVAAILRDLSTPTKASSTRIPKTLKPIDVSDAEAAVTRLASAYRDESQRHELIASSKGLESALAELFRRAGATVVTADESDDQGADLALWIEEVQTTIGNPILTEVKTGRLDPARLATAEHALRSWLLQARTFMGLLVYWDANGKAFSKTMGVFPLVKLMSVEELLTSLRHGTLASELVAVRNKAVHGI